jgi:hypothetical protein
MPLGLIRSLTLYAHMLSVYMRAHAKLIDAL